MTTRRPWTNAELQHLLRDDAKSGAKERSIDERLKA